MYKCVQVLKRSEGGIRSSAAIVIGVCEPPDMITGN